MCKENRILELGKIFVSRRILAELTTEKINEVISWHQNGCIIMLGNKDWIENDHAVEKDKRIVSQHFVDGESVFIITEADRSSTTIMLGYEY